MTHDQIIQLLVFLIPAIGTALPGILKQDKLPAPANGAIALGVILIIAFVQCLVAGQIGINPYVDFFVVVGAMSALIGGPFKETDMFLQSFVHVPTTSIKEPPIKDQSSV